jgi:cell division septation protein DedD
MLYEQNEKQNELFEEFKAKEGGLRLFKSQKGLAQNKIFLFQFSIEKLVIMLIAFVLIIILTFCIGVERGKYVVGAPKTIVTVKEVKQPPVPVKQQAPVYSQQVKSNIAVAPIAPVRLTPVRPVPVATNINNPVVHRGDLYTIRIATYINKKSAADESSRLRQIGFPAYIKVSDKFYMICVGDYADKKQADKALAALKKMYKDVYIKTNKK